MRAVGAATLPHDSGPVSVGEHELAECWTSHAPFYWRLRSEQQRSPSQAYTANELPGESYMHSDGCSETDTFERCDLHENQTWAITKHMIFWCYSRSDYGNHKSCKPKACATACEWPTFEYNTGIIDGVLSTTLVASCPYQSVIAESYLRVPAIKQLFAHLTSFRLSGLQSEAEKGTLCYHVNPNSKKARQKQRGIRATSPDHPQRNTPPVRSLFS